MRLSVQCSVKPGPSSNKPRCIPEGIFLNDQIFLEFRSRPLSGKAGITVDYLVKASREHAAANKMLGSIRAGWRILKKW